MRVEMNTLTINQMEEIYGGESCNGYLAGLALIVIGVGGPGSYVGLGIAVSNARDCAKVIYGWWNG